MVGEEVEPALEVIGLGSLDVLGDSLVEHRPELERHALVRDLCIRTWLKR